MANITPDIVKPEASATPPKLDELMLAMDVVDTLRHQDTIAARELGQDDRDETLKQRLRQIYESQGLAVDDRILEAGIKALKEQRFVYKPEGSDFGRSLAKLWIRRRAIGLAAAALIVAATVTIGGLLWQSSSADRAAEAERIEISQSLPSALAQAGSAALDAGRTPQARAATERLIADGEAAIARQDAVGARSIVGALGVLRARLIETYTLRIVSRDGEQSGVFRIPNINTGARNYYLIVEPVTPSGQILSLPILNEETGATETVSKFGVRVPSATFEAVRRDKSDDGIVQRNRLGEKPSGALDPVYDMPVEGGMITKW